MMGKVRGKLVGASSIDATIIDSSRDGYFSGERSDLVI